jgi:hypothetical protein
MIFTDRDMSAADEDVHGKGIDQLLDLVGKALRIVAMRPTPTLCRHRMSLVAAILPEVE